jgi:hypothetical protein
MPKYIIKVNGKTVIFKARNQREAAKVAFGISSSYSDLKRLDSRWWLLVYVLLAVVFFVFGWKLGV